MGGGRPLRQSLTDAPQERALVDAAKQDRSRFADLYEIYFDRVYAYVARRVQDRADAEDLTSEVFEQALANLGRFEWRGAPFAAWLFRIAANALHDRAVRLGREHSLESRDEVSEADQEEACDAGRLFQAVRELPELQRRVVELRFVEEKSIREAADELGRSEGAIKQLQLRALDNLRALVSGKVRTGGKHG